MPRYEFFCEDCQKPFEIILTLAEYEKGKITCPKCGGKHVHQEAAEFFAVTVEEKLKEAGSASPTSQPGQSRAARGWICLYCDYTQDWAGQEFEGSPEGSRGPFCT